VLLPTGETITQPIGAEIPAGAQLLTEQEQTAEAPPAPPRSTYAMPPVAGMRRYSGQIRSEPAPAQPEPPVAPPSAETTNAAGFTQAAVQARETERRQQEMAVLEAARVMDQTVPGTPEHEAARQAWEQAVGASEQAETAAAEASPVQSVLTPTLGPLSRGLALYNLPLQKVEEFQGRNMLESARAGEARIRYLPDLLGRQQPAATGPDQIQWAIDNAPAVIAAYENGYTPTTGAYAGQTLTGDRAVWELYAQQLNLAQRALLATAMAPENLLPGAAAAMWQERARVRVALGSRNHPVS
ncbi:MAG: hypothetical protein M3Q03_13430, partial [Chloroflexota bacterium]|nr:hypothetical protein [Chloroflexota bacterium]